MAINKNFTVKNGLEVNTSLIFADSDTRKVGIATTDPGYDLHVNGGIGVTNLVVAGVSTFSGISTFSDSVYVAGITTVDGGVSTGVTALTVIGDLRVTGDINLDDITFDTANLNDLDVAGIVTTKNLNTTGIGTFQNLVVNGGTVLSGLTTLGPLAPGFTTTFHAAVGIQSDGVVIGTGVTTINFAGIGATLVTVSGSTANVFVSGGPGISSVGIQSGGTFVGSATTVNFRGPGISSVVVSNIDSSILDVTVGVSTVIVSKQVENVSVAASSFTFTYNPASIDVYYNGSKLIKNVDYTANNGTSILLDFSAVSGDVLEFNTYFNSITDSVGSGLINNENISIPGIVTATGGFQSSGSSPVQISVSGSILTFTVAGIGSTSLTLS